MIQWFLLWMCAAAFESIKYQGLYESKVFSNNTTTHTLNLPQLLKQRMDFADCCLKQCTTASSIE